MMFFLFFFLREKYNISDQHLSYMCLRWPVLCSNTDKTLKDRQKAEEYIFYIGLKSVV